MQPRLTSNTLQTMVTRFITIVKFKEDFHSKSHLRYHYSCLCVCMLYDRPQPISSRIVLYDKEHAHIGNISNYIYVLVNCPSV